MEDFRLLVTGSRRIFNGGRRLLNDELNKYLSIAETAGKRLVVVQGECTQGGVDREAKTWGLQMKHSGLAVEVEGHPAQNHPTQDFGPWPGAGQNRNQYMVDLGADAYLGIAYACNSIYCRRRGPHSSHGAEGCVRKAKAAGIPGEFWELWKEEG